MLPAKPGPPSRVTTGGAVGSSSLSAGRLGRGCWVLLAGAGCSCRQRGPPRRRCPPPCAGPGALDQLSALLTLSSAPSERPPRPCPCVRGSPGLGAPRGLPGACPSSHSLLGSGDSRRSFHCTSCSALQPHPRAVPSLLPLPLALGILCPPGPQGVRVGPGDHLGCRASADLGRGQRAGAGGLCASCSCLCHRAPPRRPLDLACGCRVGQRREQTSLSSQEGLMDRGLEGRWGVVQRG